MKPYLAVIADSFHSALSSRILWIAFLAIWIFVGALAPIGYREDYTTTFRWFDLDNGTQMKAMLARGLVDPNESETALGRLARTFPEEVQRKLERVARGDDVRIRKDVLANSLNESLDDESWYDAQAWKSTVRLRELRELDEIPEEEIGESERRRRARLRIEAALPGVFAAQSARSITLSYAGFDFPAFFQIRKEQFQSLINQYVVPIIMDWLLGFALIFLGILVTASIVPEMLQPGSLHLLLSKPISRTMLLLSKFIGGCAFVFLCVCQLVVGLWLIAGLRLDIWNARMLWCIPVAVFLFSVFFSVSLLAGLRWRSPILSIGVTCMFGAFVLVIGFIGGYFDALVRGPDRISQFAFAGQEVVISTRGGELKWLDQESNEWTRVIEGKPRQRDLIVPPVRIGDDKVATARVQDGRFNLYGSGSLDLLILDGSDDWTPLPSMRLPTGTRRLMVVDELLIALNNNGPMATTITRAVEESGVNEATADNDESGDGEDVDAPGAIGGEDAEDGSIETDKIGVTGWIKDLLRMQGGATENFHSILPDGVTLTEPIRASVLPGSRSLIVYSRGRLMRLDLPAPTDTNEPTGASAPAPATLATDVLMEDDSAARTTLATNNHSVLMARENEPLRWLDAGDLSTLAEFAAPDDQTLLAAVGFGQTDRFALLTTDGKVRLASRTGEEVDLQELDQPDVTAIEFDPQSNTLAISYNIDCVDFVRVEDESFETVRTIRPSLSSWRSVDRLVVTPLRTVTPQTGELSQTVAALVSGKTSFAISGMGEEEQEAIRLKIARPVLSCSIFTAVMLAFSCLYFARRDF